MPGMSGTELSQAIRKKTTTITTASGRSSILYPPPVVVGLTADTSPTVADQCATAGMADVLYKPITVSELKEYFDHTAWRLQPGVWYPDKNNSNSNGSNGNNGNTNPIPVQ